MVKLVEKIVEKLKSFYKKFLKCPNTERLDKDFHALFQILYLYGFYLPNPSKIRACYGIFMYAFVLVTFLMGGYQGATTALQDGNMNQALLNVICFCYGAPLATLVLSIAKNQTKFVDMTKGLGKLHEFDQEETVEVLRKKNLKLTKIYIIFIKTLGTVGVVLPLMGYKTYRLFMPSIYDLLATGSFYELFLSLNSVHLYEFVLLLAVCDLYIIFCIIRVEYNIKFLCEELRNCTDSGLFRVSQRNIDACAKYHSTIIDKVNEIQQNFGAYLMVKVYGMFAILSTAFFVLLKEDIENEVQHTILAAVAILAVVVHLWILCYVGERLTSASEEIMNASFENNWMDQPRSFTSSLYLIRTVALKELKITAGGIHLNRENFYKIIYASYNHYANLAVLVDVMRRRGRIHLRLRPANHRH